MAASRKDRSVVHLLVTLNFFRLIKLVSCDFEFVAVGVIEINGVRDFVVLEFEFDSATSEFFLSGKKAVVVSTKGEMKHADVASS